MSEYQYYEFRTVDRRLSETEMHELRLHSTRAKITPTSFINEYNWGDFKGNAGLWMDKYFDAHLYYANWGTRILQLALPTKVLSEKTTALYCMTDVSSARRVAGKLVLKFVSEEDAGCDDSAEEAQLSSLVTLRSDIANGDFRCLYLGWLLSVQQCHIDDDDLEPPVPPNLGKLSGVLSDFVDFLRIDRDLITVAAEASPRATRPRPTRKEMAAWLASVPAKEKDGILVELMSGENPHVGAKLLARFNRDGKPTEGKAAQPRRKVAELRAATEERWNKGR